MISRELCKDQAQHLFALAGPVGHHLPGVLRLATRHSGVPVPQCGGHPRWQHGRPCAGMQHRSPASSCMRRDIKYLSGLFLLCLSFVGETKRQLAGSTGTCRLKCPRKLVGRLYLLDAMLRLTLTSAAPLPWGGAGTAPVSCLQHYPGKRKISTPMPPNVFRKYVY